jgi:hypothetical protein
MQTVDPGQDSVSTLVVLAVLGRHKTLEPLTDGCWFFGGIKDCVSRKEATISVSCHQPLRSSRSHSVM